jgi:hypothetical protein
MRLTPPTSLLFCTCFALSAVAGAWTQQTRPANPPQKRDAPLTRSSFTAKGLHYEDDLTDLFSGNFADVTLDRGSLVFSQLFEMYLEAYSRSCKASLPPNKVEITTQVCNDPPAPIRQPDEPEPLQHGCMSWKTVSLGWAKPGLYAVKRRFDAEQSVNQVKNMVGSIRNIMRPVADIVQVQADTNALVRLNACDGPGLKRFEDNLALFSLGKQALLLPGEPAPTAPKILSAGELAQSDFNRLVEDLMADQARAWRLNRYVPGSTSLGIVAHDPRGQPSQIRAKYLYTSPLQSGRTQGSLIVSFTDGMPACLYFSDAPTICQEPDRRIVTRYSHGGYVDTNAVQAKADAEARAGVYICVPDDLLAEWRNPVPDSKMAAFRHRILRDPFFDGHADLPDKEKSNWITVHSSAYANWSPGGPFNGAMTITDGGSCAVGHREFLARNAPDTYHVKTSSEPPAIAPGGRRSRFSNTQDAGRPR